MTTPWDGLPPVETNGPPGRKLAPRPQPPLWTFAYVWHATYAVLAIVAGALMVSPLAPRGHVHTAVELAAMGCILGYMAFDEGAMARAYLKRDNDLKVDAWYEGRPLPLIAATFAAPLLVGTALLSVWPPDIGYGFIIALVFGLYFLATRLLRRR